jgi:hypothetical protein
MEYNRRLYSTGNTVKICGITREKNYGNGRSYNSLTEHGKHSAEKYGYLKGHLGYSRQYSVKLIKQVQSYGHVYCT